jgi:hypothetical protein
MIFLAESHAQDTIDYMRYVFPDDSLLMRVVCKIGGRRNLHQWWGPFVMNKVNLGFPTTWR